MSSPFQELQIHCDRKGKPVKTKYELSTEERLEILKEAGDAACLLMAYYLRMATIPNKNPTDEDACAYFGWNQYKVRRNRQFLTKLGYYRSLRYTLSNGRKGMNVYLGREAVQLSHRGEKLK